MFGPPRTLGYQLVALLMLGAFAEDPLVAQEPIPPDSVGEFKLAGVDTVGNAVVYRYHGPKVNGLDVFVWPISALELADLQAALLKQTRAFQEALPLGIQLGHYEHYQEAFSNDWPIVFPADTIPGHVVAAAISRRGRQRISFFFIHSVRGHFVKVRVTIPREGWSENHGYMFAERMIRLMLRE